MPFDEYVWADREALLTFEEIHRLVRIFLAQGVTQIRLTGGEPLLRRNLHELVSRLSGETQLKDLSLTTNASLLADQAGELKDAGLTRINVSLDTLREERFAELTRRGSLKLVHAGLRAAREVGFEEIKINSVIIRDTNDDEILDLVEHSRANGFQLRLIEYMDVGNANDWTLGRTVSKKEMLETIRERYPLKEASRRDGRAPSTDYAFADGRGSVGIIGSVTEPFCSSCSRARLTADGRLVTCLFSETGTDLKSLLREGASDESITARIRTVWMGRTDRYSDLRWEALQSGRYDGTNKIEMITLGG